MNYNQFSYYRANPYSNQGYMPPVAHMNRHRPDFLTQLPMGQQHLSKIGKKQFHSGIQRSNIKQDHILESPQRYPYENRIALQKTYQRNLNTIDIEGASSGSLLSEAVRNKLRARQALIRRQKAQNGEPQDRLQHLQLTEQDKRRQVALQQYVKNQQMSQMLSRKNHPSPVNHQMYDQNQQSEYRSQKTPQKYTYDKSRRQPQNQKYIPRYQSIDASSLSRNNPQPDQYQENYSRQRSNSNNKNFQNYHVLSRSRNFQEPPYLPPPKDRKQARMQNPTNLSSESSIYLAGRNIMQQQ